MVSVRSVSKLSTESVGSRCELVANCVHTADATKQFRRVGVGDVYWALRLALFSVMIFRGCIVCMKYKIKFT